MKWRPTAAQLKADYEREHLRAHGIRIAADKKGSWWSITIHSSGQPITVKRRDFDLIRTIAYLKSLPDFKETPPKPLAASIDPF